MDRKRRAAWESALAKLDRDERVPPEEGDALSQEGMFNGVKKADAAEEANLFLRYLLHGQNRSPLPWFGTFLARHWLWLHKTDKRLGRSRAETAMRHYIAADDFDHWTALNLIAARLHRDRQQFPEALADWAADLHEGTHLTPPPKEKSNAGEPPYVHEYRNGSYAMADECLERFGMTSAADRHAAIAGFTGDDEDVVRKGLKRWRDLSWRRAPWPEFPKGD